MNENQSLTNDIFSTDATKRIEKTREEALQSYMAGQQVTTPFEQNKKPAITQDTFSTQQQVLSNLNLLDENLNATDTYTNYINQGGSPVPGYEADHDNLLFLDKVNDYQNQIEQGTISKQSALWDLYGHDILAQNGYNLDNVGWWINKFSNKDYSNPLKNQPLISSVLSQAESYHNQLLAQEYAAKKKVQDSHLSTLLNKGDLSNEDIKTLFPELIEALDKIKDEDKTYQWYISSNQVPALSRVYQSETGDRYYLHTDGELYKLSNTEKGSKIASFVENDDGTLKEISLNSGDIVDGLQEFKAGAFSVVSGFGKVIMGLWGATGGALVNRFTEGDWNWIESVTEAMSDVDAFNNDNVSLLFDSGRIDMDGFKADDIKDWSMFACNITGMMVGGWATGAVAGKIASAGQSLAKSGGWLSKVTGKSIEYTANLYARSTGLYRGYTNAAKPGVFTFFGKNLGSIGGWAPTLNHAKTVSMYMWKDFQNNLQQLNQQKFQYRLANPDEELPDDMWRMIGVSAANAAFNGMISMIFAGGIDDNQTERWISALTPKKGSNFVTQHLTPFLDKYHIGINIASEFIDNATTIYTGNIIGWDNERNSFGDMITNGAYIYDENGNKRFDTTIAMKSIIQGAITTIPTASGQLQRRNIAGENAHTIWTKLLADLDKKEADASNPENKHVVRELKALLVESFNSAELKDQTLTQRIFTVLDNAHNQLKDGQGNSIITKAIKEVCDPKMMSVYKEMNDAAIASYNKYLDKHKGNDKTQRLKGVRKLIDNTVGEYFRNKFTQRNNANAFTLQDSDIQGFSNNLYKYFVKSTGISESESSAETLRRQIEVTAEELDRVEDVAYNYNEYAKTHSKEDQLKAHNAAEVLAETLGVDTQTIKDSTKYFTFKNETDDRSLLHSNLAAMTLLTKVLPNVAYKIDDYTYGIVGSGNNLSNMFTNDVANKMLLSMHALKTNPEAAVDLYMKTVLGDELFKHTIEQDKAVTKELVEDYLQTAIDNNVIDKFEAAQFLITLKDKAGDDTEIKQALTKVFNTELTIKNVTKTGLSDLELYAVMYRAAMQLQNPEESRFSGPTIAAEVILDSDTKISREIIEDLVKHEAVNPDFNSIYYNKLIEFNKEKVFSLAANKFYSEIVEIIGEEGIKDLPSEQNLEKSDIKTYLKAIANTTDSEALRTRINNLLELGKTLGSFNGITFKGDKLTLDLTSYMDVSVEKFIKEVARTQPGSEVSKETKDTYSEKPSDDAAHNYLETATKLVDLGKAYITIDLNTADMDDIKKIYHIMNDAGMFTSMAETEPKTVEEFKTYIHNYLTDIGKEFAISKKGTEFKTNLIDPKEASKIVENLHLLDNDQKIAKIREIDPSNKAIVTYDYYTLLKNNIDIKNISEDMASLMRTTVDEDGTPIGVIVNPVKYGTMKHDGLEISAFIKLPTGVTDKSGRTASKTGENYAAINMPAVAMDVNKDMTIKLMLNNFIDYMYDLPQIDATVSRKKMLKLTEMGLINTDDSFFTSVDMPGEDYVRLHLSKDKDAMKHYVETNKDINLYMILPFFSDEIANTDINFNTPQAKLLGDIPDIQNRGITTYTNIMGLLNLTFEFDKSNTVKTALFKEFFAAKDSLNYNPFSKNNIPLNMAIVRDKLEIDDNVSDIEAYKTYRSGSIMEGADDYLYALIETYKQLQSDYINNESNDDYKVWLHNANVLKRMIDFAQSNTDVDTVVKETIKAYGDSTYRATIGDYDAITLTKADNFIVGSSFGIPSNIVGVDTIMSKTLLDNDMGIQYELVDMNGKPKIAGAEQQIKDAYDYVKNMITKYSSIQEMLDVVSRPIDKVFRVYEPSDVVKLQAIFGASEGNIMIEDIDTLARIEADAYNEFFAKIGFENGYGAKVYNKVISLRDSLMKHIGKSAEIQYSVSKAAKKETITPKKATTSEMYDAIPKARGDLKSIEKYMNDYVRTNEEDININTSPDRLIDVLGSESRKVAEDYIRTRAAEDPFAKAYYDRVQEIAVRDNADIHGQTLISDITSDINLYKRLNATRNTKTSFDGIYKELGFNVNKELDDSLIKYTTDLVHRASGVDYLSHWSKFSFLDPTTGKEYDSAVIERVGSQLSHLDLLDVVTKHGNNLIGKIFIDLEKQKVDSSDGLSFGYKYIRNEEDVSNLKTDLMLKVIQENLYKADGNYKKATDLVNKMTQKELQVFLQKAARDNLGTVAKTRYLLSLMNETNIQVPYRYLIQPQNFKNDLLKNFIADHYDNPVGARFDKDPQVKRMFNVIEFGIDYDGLDDAHREEVNKFFEGMYNKYFTDYEESIESTSNTLRHFYNKMEISELSDNDWAAIQKEYGIAKDASTEDLIKAAKRFILDRAKTPEVMSYLFNKRKSLNTMYKEYQKGMPDTYTLSDKTKISIQDFKDFISEGVKSNLKKVIFFDTEGSNKIKPTTGKSASTIRDLFQISYVIYTKDELGNLNREHVTKFIKHDITPEEWVKLNIDYGNKFYKDNEEYQRAVKAYMKASEQDMITYDQIKDIMTGRLSSEPDFIVAYNGNNYEFEVMKDYLGNTKKLDAIATVLKEYSDTTQKIGQEDVYKRTFSTDRGEKHSADQDTLDMIDLIGKVMDLNSRMAEDRSKLVLDLKHLINTDDEAVIRKVFSGVNQWFVKDDNYKNITKDFNNYTPTLDNIKQLQRAFNYLSNDMDGRALFDILDMLNAESTYAQFVNLSKGHIDNALDVIAIKMLETNGNYSEAVNKITEAFFGKDGDVDRFDNKSFDNFVKLLGSKDDDFLTKVGVDPALTHNSEVAGYKKYLISEFVKGIYGINNKKISVLKSDEAKIYAENFNNLAYITGAQSIIIDNKDFVSETVKNSLVNTLGSGILSLKEGMDVQELQSRLNTTLDYNSKLIDQLAAQAQNIIGESKGTGTFRAIFHMSVALNPQENNINEIVYKGNGEFDRNVGKLRNVQSGEISLTLDFLREKLNITDLDDIRAADGNLYILSITNPSDTMTPILPLRVRLVEGDQMSAGFTPDTQEILRNRDFDGDHTLTSMLTGEMKTIAPLLYNYMFSPYNVHSKLTNYLTIKENRTKRTKGRNYAIKDNARIFMLGVQNEGVKKASIELDKILTKYSGLPKLTEEAKTEINMVYEDMVSSIKQDKDYPQLMLSLGYVISDNPTEFTDDEVKFFNKVKELLGVKEVYKNKSDTKRFVNNPYLYAKNIDGYETYTYTSRLGSFARQLLEKTNTGDPRIGYYQKILSALPIKSRVINNPLLDLYTPNIYMTDTLESKIDNIVESRATYEDYLRNLNDYLKQEVTKDKYTKGSVKEYDDYLKDKFKNYSIVEEGVDLSPEEYASLAKQITMDVLWDLDFFIKHDADVQSQFKMAIEKLSTDDTFQESLNKTLELDEIVRKLTHEREKIGSKYIPYNPYSDILSQDIVMNKVNAINEHDAFNYGNKLFTKEDRELKTLDDISNNFNKVNIFLTTAFISADEDTIGVTQNSRARALSVEILDTSKNIYDVKEGQHYKAGKVIGKDENDNPIRLNRDIYVNKVTPNGIWINSEGSVVGKKLASVGIAKGDSELIEVTDKDGNLTDIDLVCDINNAFKNFDKLPVGFDASMFKNMELRKVKINGRIYTGYFIKELPFNIIGDDSKYKAVIDTKDPSSIRRFELMTTNTAETLLGVGRYGSTVLNMDDKGNMIIDFSKVQEAAQSNFKNYDVVYQDVGTEIMYYRSDALVNAMTEEEFQGFVNALDGGKYANTYISKEDYLNNLRKSMFKINSEAALNEQLDMIYYLGKDRFYELIDSCKLYQFIFGGLVNSQLNTKVNSSFTEEFWSTPRSSRSRSSSTYDFSPQERMAVEGKIINESQNDAKFSSISHNTLLHIPANVFYKGVSGKNLDTNSIIRMHLNGTMSPRYHFENSANIDTDWYAIDTQRGVRYDETAGSFVTADGKKTSLGGDVDAVKVRDLDAGKWARGIEVDDMLDVEDQPHKANFYNMLAEAFNRDYPTTGYSWDTRLGYLLALGLDNHKSKLEKYGMLRGIDTIAINKLTPQMISDQNRMYYKAIINSSTVPIKDAMKTINSNTKGFMLREDLKNTVTDLNIDNKDMKNLKAAVKHDDRVSKEQRIYETQKEKLYKQAAAALSTTKADYANSNLKLTWDTANNEIEWKTNWLTRSGIDDRGAEQLSVDIGIKNYKAEIPYIIQNYSEPLYKLKKFTNIIGTKEFETFAKYQWLDVARTVDPKNFETRLTLMGESADTLPALKKSYEAFVAKYPEVTKAYNDHVSNLLELSKVASQVTNEPFSNNFIFMMPFVSNNKDVRYNEIKSTIKNMASLSKYDPTTPRNLVQQNMSYNFFEGSERIIRDLATTIASNNVSEVLLGKHTGKALMDNTKLIDDAFNIITNTDAITNMKPFTKFDSDITKTVLDTVALYTDLDVKGIRRISKNTQELLRNCYISVNNQVKNLQQDLFEEFNKTLTLSEAYRIARGDMQNSYNKETVAMVNKLYQAMHGEIIIAQRIIEADKYSSTKLNDYISSLFNSGKVLVNKFGQKIERNGIVAPTDKASFGFLKENIEIAMNSKTPDMFNQYILEKALSGELYVMDKGLADQLEKHVWTTKVPNRVQSIFQKASSFAASIQMSMPLKLLSRLFRYTGTDYGIGIAGNYKVANYIPRAGIEISAALQSQGHNVSQDLEGYLKREGQPSLGNKTATRVDPLDPSITLKPITDNLTRPLELQNHLGRYALYLAALDGFRKQEAGEGEAWYGSQYYNHEAIDKLSSPEDKAMYVMDYMLGSPGGFPALSKKTSGFLMYATFPMNLTRTFGAYGLSLLKLFSEGVTEENKTQWYNNVVMPSVGMVGLSILSQAILTLVCDYYDVDEETEEEWKKEGVTLDPIGTVLGGTPSVTYDSINPANQFKEMFINPFTNEYNDTIPKKAYGWMKSNVISSLNPIAKIPIELVTGKDLWGDSAEGYKNAQGLFESTNKYQYTNLENGMKKVYGILIGSGMANSIVDQFKMDSYDPSEPSFVSTLWKGFTKGVANDLGNQKSWKKDTSNYYSILTDMKKYSKISKDVSGNTYGNNYYYSVEDLTNTDKLQYARSYESKYGTFNQDDYNRISSMLKKMIHNHTDSSTLYTYIVKEYNENNVSEATLRSALNNNSIIRKLRLNSMSGYTKTLSEAELIRLQKAIDYENEYYPILQKLFPDSEYSNTYVPRYQRTYLNSGSSSRYPKTYSSPTYYYPGKYYPSTYRYNKKTGKYGPNLERVSVNVSPQMAIWNQDYNLTRYDTGYRADNEPKWLRGRGYVNRTN